MIWIAGVGLLLLSVAGCAISFYLGMQYAMDQIEDAVDEPAPIEKANPRGYRLHPVQFGRNPTSGTD